MILSIGVCVRRFDCHRYSPLFIVCQHCSLEQIILQKGNFVTSLPYVGRLLKLLNYSDDEVAVFSLYRLIHGIANPAWVQNRKLFVIAVDASAETC